MATVAWRDLALDSSGDLVITSGDFVLIQGTDAIVQECGTALRLWAGEYPFDTELGMPWGDLLNVKGITDAQIASAVRTVLQNVDGVVSVDNVTIQRNTTARTATVDATVRADEGIVLTIPTIELGVGV